VTRRGNRSEESKAISWELKLTANEFMASKGRSFSLLGGWKRLNMRSINKLINESFIAIISLCPIPSLDQRSASKFQILFASVFGVCVKFTILQIYTSPTRKQTHFVSYLPIGKLSIEVVITERSPGRRIYVRKEGENTPQ
jgi:hypothetical protein